MKDDTQSHNRNLTPLEVKLLDTLADLNPFETITIIVGRDKKVKTLRVCREQNIILDDTD